MMTMAATIKTEFFACRYCQCELGRTDGVRLLVDVLIGERVKTLVIRESVRIGCPDCHRQTKWSKPPACQVKSDFTLAQVVVG